MRYAIFAPAVLALSLAVGGCVDTVSVGAGNFAGAGYVSSGMPHGGGGVRIVRRGENAYFNGHRGYRNHRNGYRSYQGYWFPDAAFIGITIGTGGYHQDRARHAGNSHIAWCADRYRSFRVSDNSFNSGNGRRACNSPYN